jgi:hypothetical protein
MRIFIKIAFSCCLMATTAQTGAEPSASSVPAPKFRKGIWASKHYQEVAGLPPRQDPEHILDRCVTPAESIRRGLLSAEKDGCEIKLDSETAHSFVYSSRCPGGTVRTTVETADPMEYRMTTEFPQARHVQLGHWVRDCSTASDLALPGLKRGVWSVITEEHRADRSTQKTSEEVLKPCGDPSAFIRQKMMAAESGGCSEWELLSSGGEHSYNSTCTGKAFSFTVASTNASEFRIIRGFSEAMTVTTGQWLADCPAGRSQNAGMPATSR